MRKIIFICILILLIGVILCTKSNFEGFANNEQPKEIIWENKLLKLDDVITKLQNELGECGVNNITLDKTDFNVINSRKRLIELLPVTKLLDKITYEQIKCFVSKFDPENYLVIGKTITNVPKFLRPKNIVIVNNFLYQSTPYGVIKYKIPQLDNFNGLYGLNASIECGIINDLNTYNMSSEPVFHLEGKLIQKQENKFVDIKNNDYYAITNINNKIEFLNQKIINKIESDKITNTQVQNHIQSENKKQIKQTNQTKQIKQTNQIKKNKQIIENMVDVGGIVELNISNVNQLKVIDSKTFLPVVTSSNTTATTTTPSQTDTTSQATTSTTTPSQTSTTTADQTTTNQANATTSTGQTTTNQATTSTTTPSQTSTTTADQTATNQANATTSTGQTTTNQATTSTTTGQTSTTTADQTATNQANTSTSTGQITTTDQTATTPDNSTIPEISIEKLNETLVSIFEYDGIIYMANSTTIRPYSSWAIKVNNLLGKNKLEIKGVIPHFYYLNNVFNYRLCIILSDDFYIWVNKENVSGILDVKKDWNITFNPNIPDTLPCDELKIILEQMENANIISKEKSNLIIKNYRC